jgi:hypothetical protein
VAKHSSVSKVFQLAPRGFLTAAESAQVTNLPLKDTRTRDAAVFDDAPIERALCHPCDVPYNRGTFLIKPLCEKSPQRSGSARRALLKKPPGKIHAQGIGGSLLGQFKLLAVVERHFSVFNFYAGTQRS